MSGAGIPSPEPLLQVTDLRTSFFLGDREAKAVDGVSFAVAPGEVVGIVGESGCGKSVTALSLMGLLPSPPAQVLGGSSVRWQGEELIGASRERMRRLRGAEMAMIFQEPMTSLNPVQRVGPQIAEGLRVQRGLSRGDAREKATALLSEVGIPDAGERYRAYPHELSGGMSQRVMIAMALACDPGLLIADEPTTALDVTIQAQILDLLREMRERRGMAILFITHDLGVVAELCDRVLVMYAGQVVESALVDELFAEPKHPYTRGLLGSLPGRGERGAPLTSIRGSVPSPDEWPEGCRFHPRCPLAWERCRGEAPPLLRDVSDRVARCWLQEGDLP